MDSSTRKNDVILLFDMYDENSEKLHNSFINAGLDYQAIVINDDGFLPDNVMSVYGFFLGEFNESSEITGKPRFFNQIDIPDYWEISSDNTIGKVRDMQTERAKIFYVKPNERRMVKVVEWYSPKGVVRISEHYNKYGALYARTVFNSKGQRFSKSYFDAFGRERIVENYVTGDIIVNDDDKIYFYKNKIEFVRGFFVKAKLKQTSIYYNSLSTPFFVSQALKASVKKDVLFWQEEPREDIPGNMRVILEGKASRTAKIYVQNSESYEKFVKAGANCEILNKLGNIYSFVKENTHNKEILICTNSDNIENCEKMINELKEFTFNIVAITEMSSKLAAMGNYKNVKLYPCVKRNIADKLFEKCDIYLDINNGGQILDAVYRAFLNNQLIFGFDNTLHNRFYVANEHVYSSKACDKLIEEIKTIYNSIDSIDNHIEIQHKAAMVETINSYKDL